MIETKTTNCKYLLGEVPVSLTSQIGENECNSPIFMLSYALLS